MRTTCTSHPAYLIVCLAVIAMILIEARAIDDCYAVHSRSSSPGQFTGFIHLKDDSTILNPASLLFPTGEVSYGAAFKDGLFYGIEFGNSDSLYYLVTMPHVDNPTRTRVSANSVGFSDVEALACVGNELIAASLDFSPPHHTDFISIDSTTGIGTLIGAGSLDVMIVGLAFDPISGVLYGAGRPYVTVSGYNLFTIDPTTGATTFVGNIGHPIQSLTVSPSLGLVGAMGNLISIDPDTGDGTQIGTTDYSLGMGVGPGIFNGLYALAAEPPVAVAPFTILNVGLTPEGDIEMTWSSESGYTYQIESSSTLQTGSWTDFGPPMPGVPPTMSTSSPVTSDSLFFRVVKTIP